MTAFNSVDKLKRRTLSELEGLNMAIVQDSNREQNSTVSMKNTANVSTNLNKWSKLIRRTIAEIKGLKIITIQDSFRRNSHTVKMQNTTRDTTGFNNWNKVIRRKYEEIQGLYVSVMEKSNVILTVKAINIRLIKPMKTYANKIKLLFNYSNKTKY